jgi:chromosome segregation ATPase
MDPSVPLYHDRIIVAHQKRSSYEPPAIIRYDDRRGEAVGSPGAVDFQGQERIVQVPGPERIVYTEKVVEKVVEVPGPERIVEVQVPGPERVVYNDKIVEKIVEVPGPERVVYNEKIVEKVVEVPGPERIVEVQVPGPERIVYNDKIVEKTVEVPGPERIVEVQVPGPERIVYTEKIVEKIVEVPVERIVEKIVHVNVESVVEAEAPATSPPRSSSPLLLPLPSSNRSAHTKEPSSNTTASQVSEHASDELEELRSKYTEAHALLEAACKERDAAVAQVPSLRSAAEFAKDQLHLKTSELARLDKELAELRAQCQGSEEQNIKLIELQARVTARESDVGRLREEVARLKEEAQTCAREIAHLKGENSAQKEVHASQIAEMQALAGDARLYAIEHEHKLVAQKKLEDARFKILGLEEQIEQLHVLRSTDVVRASEAATVTVQDRLQARETEIQELRAQVEQFKGDIEAARRDRDALVVRQTQSLQDELLRVNDSLTASERHKATLEQQVLDVQKQVMDSQTQVADLHASGLKTVGELQRQVVELQGRLQASASQLSTAVDTSVVVDYKHALALKEKEIEGLRSKRAHELEEREQALEQGKRLHQELERQKEESARQKEESAALLVEEQRRAGSLTNELSLANESSREEIANLRRRLRDLNEDTSVQDAMHALRAGKEAVERDLQAQRSRGDALEGQLSRAQEELTQLRETAAQIGVMQERVRATESEMALANARLETSLERVDALQRELERKERDLTEERDRYDRLQAEMREKRGGTGAERVEWESKYAGVEKRLQEVQDLRRKGEFDLSISVKERAALEAKVNEITDEVASARVRIASLESDLRFAQQGQGESTEHLQQRIRQISESKEKYERKYRETQKQLKESQEACVRVERRYTDLQEELDTSLGPTDSQAQAAIRYFPRFFFFPCTSSYQVFPAFL